MICHASGPSTHSVLQRFTFGSLKELEEAYSEQGKKTSPNDQKWDQIPSKKHPGDHSKTRNRSNTCRGWKKPKFPNWDPRQSAQRTSQSKPKMQMTKTQTTLVATTIMLLLLRRARARNLCSKRRADIMSSLQRPSSSIWM